MGWQMNDGCRWGNGIPFKEKCVMRKAMKKLKVLVRGAGSRQCLSVAHCIVRAAEINPLGSRYKEGETRSSFPFGYKFRGIVIVIVLLVKVKLFMKRGAQ